jgi:hypothetical protein
MLQKAMLVFVFYTNAAGRYRGEGVFEKYKLDIGFHEAFRKLHEKGGSLAHYLRTVIFMFPFF